MPKILQKKLYHCFPNFKCLPAILSFETNEENIDQKTSNNFNSIFDIPSDSTTTSKSLTSSSITTTDQEEEEETDNNHNNIFFSSFEDSDYSKNFPDISNIFASQRFFFSSPGKSNSIVDFPATKTNQSPENSKVVAGGIAIQTDSPDPYTDFRRSMQEMVEAHELTTDVKDNWEFLHELLLCYLNLNTKHNHKYIIGAFSDLVVSLMSFEDTTKKTEGTTKS